MFYRIALAVPVVLVLFPLAVMPAAAQSAPLSPPEGGPHPPVPPVAASGHGTIFDSDGTPLRPTRELIARTVEFYLRAVTADEKARALRADMQDRIRSVTEELGLEPAIGHTVLVDLLAQETAVRDADRIAAIMTALRRAYFIDILSGDPHELHLHHNSGWPEDIRAKLEGIGVVTYALTEAGGEEYLRECSDSGVPNPPNWQGRNNPGGSNPGDDDRGPWKSEGGQTLNFASSAPVSHVYSYDTASVSGQPDGLCVALPRITGSTIGLLGIICLGRETGKACFWDNSGLDIDEARPISDWKGGVDLGGVDVCSDCHSGESPYVVHPGTAIDIGAAQDSPVWYEPLVKASWPQNPGPTGLLTYLPLGPMDGDCRDCHNQSYAGRFPEVGALPQYCSTVLSNAVVQTMPPGMPGDPDYAKHINALRAFCSQPSPDGTVVTVENPNENREFVSPPIVLEPYACATKVEVQGAHYGAKLTIFIDGTQVAQKDVTRPSGEVVSVPALVKDQEIRAVQEKDGVPSVPSSPVSVRDYREDYPDGLPRPEIDPTLIHECGHTIAVRHVRGADVTVFTNNADPITYTTGGEWTNLPPAIRPFVLGHSYTAEQSLCGDPGSMLSVGRSAVSPPTTMPVPVSDPATVFAGQELVGISNLAHGALTKVEVNPSGATTQFTTAVSWNPEVDVAGPHGGPLSGSETLRVTSALCQDVATEIQVSETCEGLPPPVIAPPFVGNMHVDVTDSVPGARILVYDAGGTELGDGSGAQVALSRAIVPGDVLTVIQRLAECVSREGYRVSALCTSPEQGCRG
jgi:hypothetical protein